MSLKPIFENLFKESQNVSYRSIAKQLNVSHQTIYDRVKSPNPSAETLILLSDILGYDVYVMPSDERKPKGAILISEGVSNEA